MRLFKALVDFSALVQSGAEDPSTSFHFQNFSFSKLSLRLENVLLERFQFGNRSGHVVDEITERKVCLSKHKIRIYVDKALVFFHTTAGSKSEFQTEAN